MPRFVSMVLLAAFLALALGGLVTPPGGGSTGPVRTAIASDLQATAVDVGTALAAADDTVVYKTKTGTKYHNDGCQYLSKSKIKTTLKAATDAGLEPCKVCKPPVYNGSSGDEEESSGVTVYITKTGEKYHLGDCRYLSKSKIKTTLAEAKKQGYGACKVCKPPT